MTPVSLRPMKGGFQGKAATSLNPAGHTHIIAPDTNQYHSDYTRTDATGRNE